MNYQTLEYWLERNEWEKADQETAHKLLQIVGRNGQNCLNEDDVDHLPCTELGQIDALWRAYSCDRFGFSVQQRIFHQSLSISDEQERAWDEFSDRVGWSTNDASQRVESAMPQTLPDGYFPRIVRLMPPESWQKQCEKFTRFFSRFEMCSI